MDKQTAIAWVDGQKNKEINPVTMLNGTWLRVIIQEMDQGAWDAAVKRATDILSREEDSMALLTFDQLTEDQKAQVRAMRPRWDDTRLREYDWALTRAGTVSKSLYPRDTVKFLREDEQSKCDLSQYLSARFTMAPEKKP